MIKTVGKPPSLRINYVQIKVLVLVWSLMSLVHSIFLLLLQFISNCYDVLKMIASSVLPEDWFPEIHLLTKSVSSLETPPKMWVISVVYGG